MDEKVRAPGKEKRAYVRSNVKGAIRAVTSGEQHDGMKKPKGRNETGKDPGGQWCELSGNIRHGECGDVDLADTPIRLVRSPSLV